MAVAEGQSMHPLSNADWIHAQVGKYFREGINSMFITPWGVAILQ